MCYPLTHPCVAALGVTLLTKANVETHVGEISELSFPLIGANSPSAPPLLGPSNGRRLFRLRQLLHRERRLLLRGHHSLLHCIHRLCSGCSCCLLLLGSQLLRGCICDLLLCGRCLLQGCI